MTRDEYFKCRTYAETNRARFTSGELSWQQMYMECDIATGRPKDRPLPRTAVRGMLDDIELTFNPSYQGNYGGAKKKNNVQVTHNHDDFVKLSKVTLALFDRLGEQPPADLLELCGETAR